MSRINVVRFADQKRLTRVPVWDIRRHYGTIVILAVILAVGIAGVVRERARSFSAAGPRLQTRDFGILSNEDVDCRFVHRPDIKDKCAYIKSNCPDEEAGLFSYLQLYYCRMPNAKPVAFIILLIWLGMLFSTIGIAASDFLCLNLSTIAHSLGMSESLAGVTFLAFGNGSPDVFSTFAAMRTHSGSLAVGELIGAAGFITAIVAGSMALVRPFKVARKSFVRDVGFFAVAAAFSMVFLADGSLHLWECAVMVGFYVFYVIFVVSWHWYVGRRKNRKAKEAADGIQVQGTDAEHPDLEALTEDEDTLTEDRRAGPGRRSEDIPTLETPLIPSWMEQDEDVDDDTRDRYLKELNGEMQLSRPYRPRRNTIAPIRPSLAGALEFRSALSTLEKQRNIRGSPINMGHYSDELGPPFLHIPPPIREDDQGGGGVSDPHWLSGRGRHRAVSAGDARALRLDTGALQRSVIPEIDLLGSDAEEERRSRDDTAVGTQSYTQVLQSPRFSLSPPGSELSTRQSSPAPPLERNPTHNHLAPPSADFHNPNYRRSRQSESSPVVSPHGSPRMSPQLPPLEIPGSRSCSPSPSSPLSLPARIDSDIRSIRSIRSMSRLGSIHLPPPSFSTDNGHGLQPYFQELEEPKPLRWWPYRFLPSPQVLFSTLFPTLYNWSEKSHWDKALGLMAAPSVFLLTLTLPIVEPDKEDDDILDIDPALISPSIAGRSRANTIISPLTEAPISGITNGQVGGNSNPSKPPVLLTSSDSYPSPHPHHNNLDSEESCTKDWNRWLVCAQITTAPMFVVIILWANMDDTLSPQNLLRPLLFTLLASMIVLAMLLATTTATKPPRYRPLLCFPGFIVAIAWISTIAGEVVGVLKAFGVILGISDAILGLTVFAMGNSLGDLVADITVARLGYPVMALSACFGGPMLNILLGIGIGGLYMTIHDSTRKHLKHPKLPVVYKPYEIEVSSTLVISGVTLLVTLIGLLIAVPLNRWRMDRKIGWGLVTLWSLSTAGNVAVEIVGLRKDRT